MDRNCDNCEWCGLIHPFPSEPMVVKKCIAGWDEYLEENGQHCPAWKKEVQL